jgi:ketosteroid isomerase-like protein
MTSPVAFIRRVYERFNARDIDGVLACQHDDVMWANGQDGGHVRGRDGVRQYWTRQWTMIDPHVEPIDVTVGADGEIVVATRQTVRDLAGKLLADKPVGHVFHLEDGLIKRFDIRTISERGRDG